MQNFRALGAPPPDPPNSPPPLRISAYAPDRDASFLKYHIPVSVCVRMEIQLKTKVSIEGHQKLQKQVEDLTNQIN